MTIGYNSTLYTRSREHSRLKREKETSYKEEPEIITQNYLLTKTSV